MDIFFQPILKFISDYNQSFATLAAGAIAAFIYWRTRVDEYKTAAKTIILEIKDAEKVIKVFLDVKNSDAEDHTYPTDFYKVIPNKAWSKYSHLFIKKLNNDEYQQVSDFYKNCELLEKYIEKNYNFFWVTTEERARQKERLGVEYAGKLISDNPSILLNPIEEGANKSDIEKIALLYMSNTGPYTPKGITTGIDKILNSLTLITNTPTWNRLKQIGDYKDILG